MQNHRRRNQNTEPLDPDAPRNLATLPPEVLLEIVSYAPTARYLRNLSLTSRSLCRAVEEEGWRSFTKTQFPSFKVPPYWKDAAHSLATLSRNFDRRAFIATSLVPEGLIHSLPDCKTKPRWERPKSQTMGFQPVIDSYETILDSWRSRREIVAWGAGAELIINRSERDESLQRWQNGRDNGDVDGGYSAYDWITYRNPEDIEGRDDITSVNLLQPDTVANLADGFQHVVVGRASADLTLLSLAPEFPGCITKAFRTGEASVRSADVSTKRTPLLAASLGDDRLVLYRIEDSGPMVLPASEVQSVAGTDANCRTWATRFLSSGKIAVSRGPSETLVHVYDIQGSGLSAAPVRTFGTGIGTTRGHRITSAYPLIGVPDSADDRDSTGNLLLSGGYDSFIRMHDLRCPLDMVAEFSDSADISAIFSLTMVGRERIVAGASNHALLKFFDIRMPGGRVYDYTNAMPKQQKPRIAKKVDDLAVGRADSGWNLFGLSNSHSRSNRQSSSPVYSLSRPSAASPSIYAGMENTVIRFNFTGATDSHPDPQFENSVYRNADGIIHPAQSWASKRSMDLIMYKHALKGNLELLHQKKVKNLRAGDESIADLDTRWTTQSSWRPNKGRRW